MTERELDQIFQALSHPARRAILIHIQRTPSTSGELKRAFCSSNISEMGVNNHIGVLERAQLVIKERSDDIHGKLCTYNMDLVDDAVSWLIENRLIQPT